MASRIAINWQPVEELVEFLAAADGELGTGSGRIAEEIGAAGARVNLDRPVVRGALFLLRPELMMRRIAAAWRKYNDAGRMEVVQHDQRGLAIQVVGADIPSPLFCRTITGWIREVGRVFGADVRSVRHPECSTAGAPRCRWHAEFALRGD